MMLERPSLNDFAVSLTSMPIKFPNLSSSKCERIIACGSVETDDESILNLLKERTHLIASFTRKGEVKHYVLLMAGGRKNHHFHLEVARASRFPAKFTPKTNAKISEIQEFADHFLGVMLNLSYSCDFPIDFNELPDNGPIRLLSIDAKVAGTRVQLTEGTLRVSGSRIDEISWSRRENSSIVLVRLESSSQYPICENYLFEGHELLESYFRALVLGMPTAVDI